MTAATLQTACGRGGIAVIALAGPPGAPRDVLSRIFRATGPRDVPPDGGAQILQLGYLFDPDSPGRQDVVDQVLVCSVSPAGPGRGGDVLELNIHGGPVVARRALQLLRRQGVDVLPPDAEPDMGLPPAHPRWNNPAVGRELLKLLPLARSALVVSALSQQWAGGISRLARRALDRPAAGGAARRLRGAAGALRQMHLLVHPPEVVLVGRPNVGKSTLANAMVGRQVSIVHEQAGTTRDWVRELALLGGVPIWLTDTAGIWAASGGIDAEAVRRARHRACTADLVVLLEAGSPPVVPEWLGPTPRGVLRAATKCDAAPAPAGVDAAVSARTGEGLDLLRRGILENLGLAGLDPAAARAFTPRQEGLMTRAADALDRGDGKASRDALTALLAGDAAV